MDNYKQKYNAALERAAKLRVQNPFDTVGQMVEHIFPELKEGESERIRQVLLDYMLAYKDREKWGITTFNGIPTDNIIAWLEKQGEKDPCIGCTNDKGCVTCVDGSMKETKVKPKFKVGDWVVLPLGIIAHIDSINSTDYQVTTTDGRICDFKISKQDNYRLWTIEDAKDGDVLVASDGSIFLFAGVDDCACKYYVALTTDNCLKINKEVKGGYWETSRAVYPATKEQRDLLFQKMADAGYEFVNGHITRF